jgi:hypothetical protein
MILPAMLALIAPLVFLGCDRKDSAPKNESPEPSSAPSPQPVQTAEPVATAWVDPNPIRPVDAGPPDWYKCQRPDDCVVVPAGRCCALCNPIPFEGYSAVHVKHKDDFMAFQGCATTTCEPCPPRQKGVPRSDTNFFALCEKHRCVAIDLRYSKYSQCKTNADCGVRWGLGCCEGCGDEDLVIYNPKSTLNADVCPVKRKCPPTPPECLAERRPSNGGECAGGFCQHHD